VRPNTVTAYILQQIQLPTHRDRHGLAMQAGTRTLVNGYAVTGLPLTWRILRKHNYLD
jgi:hypothetical protein